MYYMCTAVPQVPDDAGPAPGLAESSRMFLYHSTINPTKHDNSGLMGAMVITRKGEANVDGTPRGVDREFMTIFQVRACVGVVSVRMGQVYIFCIWDG